MKFVGLLTIVNDNPSLKTVNDDPSLTIINIIVNKIFFSKTIVFLKAIGLKKPFSKSLKRLKYVTKHDL